MEAVQARGEGLSEALLREKVLRLGNDPLEIVEMNVDLAEGLHLPVSELNRVRRQLVHQWQEARLEPYRKRALEAVQVNTRPRKAAGEISEAEVAVTVSDLASTRAALDGGARLIYFSGQVYKRSPGDPFAELTKAWTLGQEAGVPVFAHIERITENSALSEIRGLLGRHRFDGLLAGNFGSWELMRDFERPVHTDLSFNVFNSWAAELLASEGASLATASLELQLSQIRQLCSTASVPISIVVHGPLESMITKHCMFRIRAADISAKATRPSIFGTRRVFAFLCILTDGATCTFSIQGNSLYCPIWNRSKAAESVIFGLKAALRIRNGSAASQTYTDGVCRGRLWRCRESLPRATTFVASCSGVLINYE